MRELSEYMYICEFGDLSQLPKKIKNKKMKKNCEKICKGQNVHRIFAPSFANDTQLTSVS